MAETNFEELKRHLQFRDADQAALRRFLPQAIPHFQAITEAFYSRPNPRPDALSSSNSDSLEHIRNSVHEWLQRLLCGPWDETYFEQRTRLGRAHVKNNLPQGYMVGGISVIRAELMKVAEDRGQDPLERAMVQSALNKVLDLELAIVLETFRNAFGASILRTLPTLPNPPAARGVTAAGLAHELRNPLNSAHLQLNVARRRLSRVRPDESGQVSQAVELAEAEMSRLASLVQDILGDARPSHLSTEGGDKHGHAATHTRRAATREDSGMGTNLQQHTTSVEHHCEPVPVDDSAASQATQAAAQPDEQADEQAGEIATKRCRGRILVVDDETNARNALAELLRDDGYLVETASDGFKALPKLEEQKPDLLLTDLKMPGMDGIELMRKAHSADTDLVTVVMTAYGAVDTAVSAMRQGAADYITKPINFEELAIVLEHALDGRRLRVEAGQLRQRLSQRDRIANIVGASAPMARVFESILQVATSRASVLITGESGTGKELVAAAIHQHSTRANGPFVKLHCAALAESLLESELFGHEKGAFTGATGRRDGRFQQADGGTLFLDEIGEISPAVQVKLLRFLQEREFERVGGGQTIKVDVRIVAATNRDLTTEVREGRFREDLFYRLNVVTIEMPPLRTRGSDIPLLATRFLQRFAAENGKELRGFSDEALQRLTQYAWPGNVRELENAVERAVVVCRHNEVRAQDLSPHIVKTTARPEDGLPVVPGASLADLERYAILRTLEHTGGSTSRAAEILGISPRTIQYRLHEYADSRPAQQGKRLSASASAKAPSSLQSPKDSS